MTSPQELGRRPWVLLVDDDAENRRLVREILQAEGLSVIGEAGDGVAAVEITLEEVRGQDRARAVPGIAGLELTIGPGRHVIPLPEGDRYLGFLFARADGPEGVEHALRTAHGHLEIVIDAQR